jgi:hypothetical protein
VRTARESPVGALRNFQHAVVLCESLRLANGSVLELVGLPSNRKIDRPVVFCFAAVVTPRD